MRKWISVSVTTALIAPVIAGLLAAGSWRYGASLLDADLQPAAPTDARWRDLYWRALGATDPLPDTFRTGILTRLIPASAASQDAQHELMAHTARLLLPARALHAPVVQRHLAEAVLRFHIALRWTPAQAVDATLERAYFGRGARGLERASHAYFGRGCSSLDQGQLLALFVLTRGPAFYDPQYRQRRFQTRYLELARRTKVQTPPAHVLRALVPDTRFAQVNVDPRHSMEPVKTP
ncbi:MAG: transglycosylase domain-containing protein [Pseudoxanthomonas sp.]